MDQLNTLLFEASDKTPTFEEDLDFFVSNLFTKGGRLFLHPRSGSILLLVAAGGQASYTR